MNGADYKLQSLDCQYDKSNKLELNLRSYENAVLCEQIPPRGADKRLEQCNNYETSEAMQSVTSPPKRNVKERSHVRSWQGL